MPLKLKPYQEEFCKETLDRAFQENVDWNALSVGLFSDMGTGKSPSTILLLEWVKGMLRARNAPEANWISLIICPASVKMNWQNEFRRFAPWVKNILVIGGTREQREEQLSRIHDYQYVITNYETIRIHQQFFQSLMSVLAIVVDEAHAIKNRKAKRSRAIKSIDAKFRLALTGTPITNRPDDLWSILHFLYPGEEFYRTVKEQRIRYRSASKQWGSYWSFCSHYCKWESSRFGSKIVGGKNLDELHNKLLRTHSMVRWRRSEVLDLQPIIYRYVLLEATTDQRRLYNQLAEGYTTYVNELGTLSQKQVRTVLAQLTYFRRATTLTPREFALALGGNPPFAPDLEVPVSDEGAKQEWLLNFVKNYLDGDKALVFSDWTTCTRSLAERLKKADVGVLSIDGATPHARRFEYQEQFNGDDDVSVFIGSPAAYEGLNLQGANYVIFMNAPWIPKNIFQAYSRAHRMGQEKQVTVIFPTIIRTIDEKMVRQLKTKQADIDKAIDNGEVNAAKLFEVDSKEQILEMI